MKLLYDLHTHTLASGRAYSTLSENITFARKAGLLAYGFSDYTEQMPGAIAENMWFSNFKVIPREIDGMRILCGAEVNIIDFTGNFDMNFETAAQVDYIIASLHDVVYQSGSRQENTAALINVMRDRFVKVIGHPDDSRIPVDIAVVAREAKNAGVLLELNCASLKPLCHRLDTRENIRKMLLACMKYGTRILVSSDAHICYDVGRFDEAVRAMEEVSFPEELVANTSMQRLEDWILAERN